VSKGLLAGLACIAALVLANAAPAHASGNYTDPTGDNNAGAADLRTIVLSGTQDGNLVLTIGTGGMSGDQVIDVFIDADNNPSTGSTKSGSEFILEQDVASHSYGFAKWNGSDWADADAPTIRVGADSTNVTFMLNVSDLGGTHSFAFYVVSVGGTTDSPLYDVAPDRGVYEYALSVNGPELRGETVSTAPPAPKAGGTFVITPTNVTLASDDGQGNTTPSKYTCTARLAGSLLTGHGTGGCTVKVPVKTKGKKLVLVVSATYEGTTISVPFTYIVR
jgi:hypothetical protein